MPTSMKATFLNFLLSEKEVKRKRKEVAEETGYTTG